MVIQLWVLVEQTDHRPDQTQLIAAAAIQRHPTQQSVGVLFPAQQHPIARHVTTSSARAHQASRRDPTFICLRQT
jgi:hypothetical protein